MNILSGSLRSAVLWAMVPLTLIASRPTTGCTCANGDYKWFCIAHVFQDDGLASTDAQPCQKECCKSRQTGKASDCCKRGLCTTEHGNGAPNGKKCCSPDLHIAIAVAPAVAFAVDLDHHLLFDLPKVESVDWLVHASVLEHFIPFETGPPGDDLVISLRRLLI